MNVWSVIRKVLKVSAIVSSILLLIVSYQYLNSKIDYLAMTVEVWDAAQTKDRMEDANTNQKNDFANAASIQELERSIKKLQNEIAKLQPVIFDVQKAYNSVVVVSDTTGTGSGTVIKKTDKEMYILTAAHCVSAVIEYKSLYNIDIFATVQYFKEGTEDTELVTGATIYNASIYKYDSESDLAILKINSVDDLLNVAQIAKENPKVGEDIYTIGNPLGVYRNVSKGILSSKFVEKNFYSIDSLATFGNSGGATFNVYGELIGVPDKVPMYDMSVPESNMCLIISTPTIREFTKELFEDEADIFATQMVDLMK